ncbi:MAG: HPP family protein [Candidatus Tyrphobacter sp.]
MDSPKEGEQRPIYALIWCGIAMVLIGFAALASQRPFIFPSLGPTAIMLFSKPLQRDASPRHIILGHLAGALSGYFALWVTGLIGVSFSPHIDIARVGAAAIALALTAAITLLGKCEHAPAGATTLIVALGILPRPLDLAFLMAAVVGLAILGFLANRASGVRYPLWR